MTCSEGYALNCAFFSHSSTVTHIQHTHAHTHTVTANCLIAIFSNQWLYNASSGDTTTHFLIFCTPPIKQSETGSKPAAHCPLGQGREPGAQQGHTHIQNNTEPEHTHPHSTFYSYKLTAPSVLRKQSSTVSASRLGPAARQAPNSLSPWFFFVCLFLY